MKRCHLEIQICCRETAIWRALWNERQFVIFIDLIFYLFSAWQRKSTQRYAFRFSWKKTCSVLALFCVAMECCTWLALSRRQTVCRTFWSNLRDGRSEKCSYFAQHYIGGDTIVQCRNSILCKMLPKSRVVIVTITIESSTTVQQRCLVWVYLDT